MTPHETARGIVEANNYLTLATADRDGLPWASPVYYTPDATDFYWASRPDSRHSRNIAERTEVGIVIYDTTAPVNTGEAVYLAARAERVGDTDLDRCAGIYNGRDPALAPFTPERLRAPNPLRLYRARVLDAWVLLNDGGPDNRVPLDVPF